MKKLLIVDDEYIVRLGLKTIVDWTAFGYTVAGEAGNGREALAFFEKNPVDLILADIKMPVMDGLALTERIRAQNKKVKIIILSHYDEFSYAQEAVKLGAFRYILKSELTRTNLETVLKSLHLSFDDGGSGADMAAENDGGGQKTGWKAPWEAFIETALLPGFLRGAVDGDTGRPPSADILPPSVPPPFNDARLVLFSASCRTTTLLNEARTKFPKTVQVLFEEAYGAAGRGRYCDDDFQFIAAAFVSPALCAPSKIEKPCIQIVKNLRQYYDVNFFIGVSSAETSSAGESSAANHLLEEAHRARIACFFRTKEFTGISGESLTTPQPPSPPVKRSAISYEKLVGFIEAGQKEAMLEYIQNIFRELREGKSYAASHDVFIDFLSAGKLIHGKFRRCGNVYL